MAPRSRECLRAGYSGQRFAPTALDLEGSRSRVGSRDAFAGWRSPCETDGARSAIGAKVAHSGPLRDTREPKRGLGRAPTGVTATRNAFPASSMRQASAAVVPRKGGHAPEVAGTGRGWTNPSARSVSYTVFVSVAIWSSAVALFSPMAMISPESGK
jgi:hypothetical protein